MTEETKVAPAAPIACAEHLVVKDTFWMITGKARAVPGDAYCVRCSQPVPYKLVLNADGRWEGQPV